MLKTKEFSVKPLDNKRLANLCGSYDENLRQIERALAISIERNNDHFKIRGAPDDIKFAQRLIKQFYLDSANAPLTLERIQLALIEFTNSAKENLTLASNGPEINQSFTSLRTRNSTLHGRTINQKRYINEILNNDICFGIGPAGTGKTYLAVACAVDAFERESVERIILVRPAVEAGEHLGFLPGDLVQKVDPYLRPLYDALYELMGFERVTKCLERGTIEIAPLAFMRGRTLNRAFIILDEAQNTTPEQMKMFLTRIGLGSKAVITGDLTQIDLVRGQKSGLANVEEILGKVNGISFLHFDQQDVVRHPLVARIVAAYQDHSN